MRILHVFHFAGVGGVETYSRLLLGELERRGVQNVVVHGGPAARGETSSRVSHQVAGLDEPWYASTSVANSLDAIAGRSQASMAFLHTPLPRAVAERVYTRMPAIFFAHNYGGLCPSGGRFYHRDSSICNLHAVPDARCLANAFLKRCNSRRPNLLAATYRLTRDTNLWIRGLWAVVCGSDHVAGAYRDSGVPDSMLRVLPYGIQTEVSARSTGTEPIVLFAGRLIPHKGADQLIRAFESVPPPARLVISGSGPDLARLETLVHRLGLEQRVEFKGDHVPAHDLYPSASLVVMPSIWPEPFGLVGLEAMAHGLPVVASRVGGIPEWLADGEVGYLVEPKDVTGLAARINLLLSDPPLARRLGWAGQALVRRRHTVSGYVDRVLELVKAGAGAERAAVG